MGKTHEINKDIRNEMLIKYNASISVQYLSKLYKVVRQHVYYQINKHIKMNSTNNLARSGRPRKTTPREDSIILGKVKEDALITPKAVSISMNEEYNISVSRKTIERRLKEVNFAPYVPRQVPYISQKISLSVWHLLKNLLTSLNLFGNKYYGLMKVHLSIMDRKR